MGDHDGLRNLRGHIVRESDRSPLGRLSLVWILVFSCSVDLNYQPGSLRLHEKIMEIFISELQITHTVFSKVLASKNSMTICCKMKRSARQN